MIKSLMKVTVLGLLALAVSGTPIVLHAQDTNAPATTNKPAANPALRPVPFHGKVKAIDMGAMTITVAMRTFQITSQSIITKDGKPATLSDGAVGDNATGQVKREAVGTEGKWTVVKLNFGVVTPRTGASNTKTNTPNSP
ncbi:MAG TPA: hypothetical protein VKV04_25730 [Verrucomicrobiae bacterium]|nr:hypothetical protein [Verrucomicrobiae bacterium]